MILLQVDPTAGVPPTLWGLFALLILTILGWQTLRMRSDRIDVQERRKQFDAFIAAIIASEAKNSVKIDAVLATQIRQTEILDLMKNELLARALRKPENGHPI